MRSDVVPSPQDRPRVRLHAIEGATSFGDTALLRNVSLDSIGSPGRR